jgi:hypothetical protein
MQTWFSYWRRVAGRAWRDTLSVNGWRLYLTIGLATLRLILPYRLNELPGKVGPAIIFLLTAYLVVAMGEYLFRFLHTPAVLDREQRTSLDDAASRISELELTRPSVAVALEGPNLRVENNGPLAKFEAKLVVLKESKWPDMQSSPHEALWAKTRKACSDIPQHGYDYILLGAPAGELAPGKVRLRYFNQTSQAPDHTSAPGPASLRLQISIYTTPPALNGPVVREIELTAEGCRPIPPEDAGAPDPLA